MRNLEREIGTVCRKVAREVAEGKAKGKVTISAKRARELLGQAPVLRRAAAPHQGHPGVATGLAWTPVGGEVLFVEATAMPGDGKLTITGQLGEVMRESAQAALSWVRGHQRGAGAEAARGLVRRRTTSTSTSPPARSRRMARRPAWRWRSRSRRSSRAKPVSPDVAMTGEMTLTGQVLPIGGLKEKSLAAQRAGHQADHRPGAQRGRRRRDPGARARGPRVRLRRHHREGPGGRAVGSQSRVYAGYMLDAEPNPNRRGEFRDGSKEHEGR